MTDEEIVSFALLDLYTLTDAAYVHSYHPPSGKTYQASLVRIPRLVNGRPTRERFHVDFIVQFGELLILQELKGAAAQCDADVRKIAELVSCYSAKELVSLIKRRSPVPKLLDEVTECIGSVAYLNGVLSRPVNDLLEVRVGSPLMWRFERRSSSLRAASLISNLMKQMLRHQAAQLPHEE